MTEMGQRYLFHIDAVPGRGRVGWDLAFRHKNPIMTDRQTDKLRAIVHRIHSLGVAW